MSTIAAIRPDEWNLPLLVHVTGAMVLVGALVTAVAALVAARSSPAAPMRRIAFRPLLLGALPSFVVMRGTAEWVFSEEDVDEDAVWIGIGFIVSDLGLLLLIAATVLAGLSTRRARDATADPGRLGRVSAALIGVMLIGYSVAIWAMTAKPD